MPYPIRVCVVCSQEFELKPDKPGFANRCPDCSAPEWDAPAKDQRIDSNDRRAQSEMDEARRRAMRDLLYRKDS